LYSEIKLSGKELSAELLINDVEEYVGSIRELLNNFSEDFKKAKDELIGILESEISACSDMDKAGKLQIALEKVKNDQPYNFGNDTRGNKYEHVRYAVNKIKSMPQYHIIIEKGINLELSKDEWAIKKAVIQIILGLDSHISEFKRSEGLLEQNDLHLMFLEMLNDESLKVLLQDQFEHLLIDEFQDTNWLQDRIIGNLKSEKNKLFIVGDKKQSIYRFQQCDVQIYEKYLEKFKTLTFTDNFRSTPDIVNFNNEIFSEDSDTVRDEYKIIEKNEKSEAKKKNAHDTPINFYNIFSPDELTKDTKAEDNKTIIKKKLNVNANNRLIKMSEAAFVSDTIRKNCSDPEDYGNWAILIRKYTHIGYITEAFRKLEIPYTLILKRDLFKLNEVLEFINILKVGMGVIKLSEIEFIDNAEKIFEDINDTDDISSMIYKIFYSKTYKNYLYGFEDAETKLSNIEILISNLMALLTDAESDKEKFLTDMDINVENNSAGVVVHNPKAVTIITVHSAKGLEFDNLILANIDEYENNMGDLFNFLNLWDGKQNYVDFSMSGYKNVTGGSQGNFFLNEYIKHKNKEFSTREKANLLYVAMTRAKKSLSVIISTKKKENGDNDDSKTLGWAKYLKDYGSEMDGAIKGFKFHQLPVTDFDLRPFIDPKEEDKKSFNISVERDHEIIFEFNKDIESATSIAHKDDEPSHETGSSIAIDTGNFVHLFLSKEIDNIFKPNYDLKTELKEFKKLNSDSQGVSLKTVGKMLENIQSDENFRIAVQSGKLLCEKNIVQVSDGKKLQGYIDLVIVKDDVVIVLDYKTYLKNFPDDDTLKKYQIQVDIYADALSKIYPEKKVEKYLYFIGVGEAELKAV
ncbi:MAG: UvrD-helicase domain-containing protein, partial [Candidatus Delongbacteria bacterium]|nr:UvrD-helicase domain-containing protein [Candidatus Delongbacteria bacterium]